MCLQLGSYVPLMSFYKLISEIFFFSICMAENGPLNVPKSVFCRYLKNKGPGHGALCCIQY